MCVYAHEKRMARLLANDEHQAGGKGKCFKCFSQAGNDYLTPIDANESKRKRKHVRV